jgi:hypothetical protein
MGGRFRETALETEQSQRRSFDLRMMLRRRRTCGRRIAAIVCKLRS